MIEKIELIDAELDAVCGGSGSVNIGNPLTLLNLNSQSATAFGGTSFFGDVGPTIAQNNNGPQTNAVSFG
jgi:hypothetical protein